MPTTLDVSEDWREWDNREDCRLFSFNGTSFDEFSIEADDDSGGVLKFMGSRDEVEYNGMIVTAMTVIWDIPRANLGLAPRPKVGDKIINIPQNTDDDEITHIITKVDTIVWQTCFRCTTIVNN